MLHVGYPRRLLEAVRAGHGVDIGVLGASMAQNGGCTDMQRRCYEFSGLRHVQRRVVEQDGRVAITHAPTEGFVTRFAHHLESHGANGVRIHNAGLDATPIQHVLDCLHTFIPTRIDAVILEPGSMAKFSTRKDVERIVGRLLSMSPPPSLIFVIFHEWFGQRTHRFYALNESTPWLRMERAALALCIKHAAACISPRHDLYARVDANRSLLAQYVGPDGLHIANSRLGIEHTTSLLVNWWERVVALPVPPPTLDLSSVTTGRPPPATRCYRFADISHRFFKIAPQRFARVPWTTSPCPICPPLSRKRPLKCDSAFPVWRFCTHARSHSDSGLYRKFSPALVGMHTNATLEVTFDTAFAKGTATVVLQYLTSPAATAGSFAYRCSKCTCEGGEVVAHDATIGNSIYTSKRVAVSSSPHCRLTLTVTRPEIRIRYAHVEIA